jgi:hypothetical protein
MLQEFLVYYRNFDPQKLTDEQIREYLLYLIEHRDISLSYQNQSINAIKFYYEQVLGRAVKTYYIQRPKRDDRDLHTYNQKRYGENQESVG